MENLEILSTVDTIILFLSIFIMIGTMYYFILGIYLDSHSDYNETKSKKLISKTSDKENESSKKDNTNKKQRKIKLAISKKKGKNM